MVKNNAILIIIVFVLLVIISCGEPPQDTKEVKLIEFIKENMDILNEIKNDENKFVQYFKDMTSKLQVVLSFEKDTTIYINSEKMEPGPNDFTYSIDNNQFIICRPVYITFYKKETLYSFDKVKWYSNYNDANKAIEGVRNNYFVKSRIDNKTLYVDYKMAFSLGRNPKIVDFKENRETVKLKKGMIFSNMDKTRINTDLEKKILFIPENTLLSGRMNVSGNIINSRLDEKSICLTAMQDLYFFLRKNMFSFSFDKVNWNLNLLAFSVDPQIEVYAKEDNHIYGNINASANYHENEVSFSLIKLLIDNM